MAQLLSHKRYSLVLVFIGYKFNNTSRQYRLYNMETRKVVTSQDVIFDKRCFPAAKLEASFWGGHSPDVSFLDDKGHTVRNNIRTYHDPRGRAWSIESGHLPTLVMSPADFLPQDRNSFQCALEEAQRTSGPR